MLSTLDWALIETWREAGIPLEAVLRGIDCAFDKYDAKASRAKGRTQRVNGLAWCSQAVMEAAEEAVEAATGASLNVKRSDATESGFEQERVAVFLERNADALTKSAAMKLAGSAETVGAAATKLRGLAQEMRAEAGLALDELDRTLTVMEERLVAAVRAAVSEDEMVELRGQAEGELAPYRAKMAPAQLKTIVAQFEQKRLMERYKLPRLSLFYMGHE